MVQIGHFGIGVWQRIRFWVRRGQFSIRKTERFPRVYFALSRFV